MGCLSDIHSHLHQTGQTGRGTGSILLGFSLTFYSDGGGAQHIRRENPTYKTSLFGLSKAQRPYMLLAPVDLGPMGAHAHGNEPGQL